MASESISQIHGEIAVQHCILSGAFALLDDDDFANRLGMLTTDGEEDHLLERFMAIKVAFSVTLCELEKAIDLLDEVRQ